MQQALPVLIFFANLADVPIHLDGLAISKKEYDWKPYPVIHLDLNGWSFHGLKETRNSLSGLVQECAEDHHIALNATEPCEMFRELIRTLSAGEQKVVVLIDEYDKPILNNVSAPCALSKCFRQILQPRSPAMDYRGYFL